MKWLNDLASESFQWSVAKQETENWIVVGQWWKIGPIWVAWSMDDGYRLTFRNTTAYKHAGAAKCRMDEAQRQQ